MNLNELWQAALGEIELNISRANFLTWFKNSAIVDKKNDVVFIATPSNFTKEWLQNKYHKYILRALRNLSPDVKQIKYIVSSEISPSVVKIAPKPKPERVINTLIDEQLNFPEFNIDPETNLNSKYTFETYVVGANNELAQAAALSITQNIGAKYNPLFIYGGVGLGKTHLIQAIGNKIKVDQGKKIKVRYLSSEKFTSDLVSSLRQQTMEDFKKQFRNLDVLLIDDVQFMAGKDKTQEELFHVFNTLYERNKQIVFTSDRSPKAIPSIEARLRSRFEGGMIADISSPDFETRLAILKTKLQSKNYSMPTEILEYIAQSVPKNIRELEGALNRVIAHFKLKNSNPTLSDAKQVLSSILEQPVKIINGKDIIKKVGEFYGVSDADILKQSRKRDIVKPRQIAMYLFREELKSSYPYIGEVFGGRDHTTVIHACEKIEKGLSSDSLLSQEITNLREILYNQ